jgi:hypothetical protein
MEPTGQRLATDLVGGWAEVIRCPLCGAGRSRTPGSADDGRHRRLVIDPTLAP